MFASNAVAPTTVLPETDPAPSPIVTLFILASAVPVIAPVTDTPALVVSNFLLLSKKSSTELFELATILFSPATGCITTLLVPLP